MLTDSPDIAHRAIAQRGTLLFVTATASGVPTQSQRLAEFVQCMLGNRPLHPGDAPACQIRSSAAGSPDCAALSAGVAPLAPDCQHVAFDLGALQYLRDISKTAVLAPACLDRDFAHLASHSTAQLVRMLALQDALLTCSALAVFDATHVRQLIAFGAQRIGLIRLPSLPLLCDVKPTIDVLLIAHDCSDEDRRLALVLEQCIRATLPELTLRRSAPDAAPLEARIHIHVGDPNPASDLRVIDSQAMHRPVIRVSANSPGPEAEMQVVPMRTGLTAVGVADAMAALHWLLAHPVFMEIFCKNARAVVESFNRDAEAQLREALV